MTKNEQDRVNQFIKNITNGPNRFLIQQPGEEKHTMVVTLSHIVTEVGEMVKDLEAMEDEQKD